MSPPLPPGREWGREPSLPWLNTYSRVCGFKRALRNSPCCVALHLGARAREGDTFSRVAATRAPFFPRSMERYVE